MLKFQPCDLVPFCCNIEYWIKMLDYFRTIVFSVLLVLYFLCKYLDSWGIVCSWNLMHRFKPDNVGVTLPRTRTWARTSIKTEMIISPLRKFVNLTKAPICSDLWKLLFGFFCCQLTLVCLMLLNINTN